MADIENPLLIYKVWFSDLPEHWGEQIAGFAFHTLRHYQPLQHYCLKPAGKPGDLVTGEAGYSLWLSAMVNDHICNQDPYLVQELAVLLHISTHMVIDSQRQVKNKQVEFYKTAYLQNLLIGDLLAAAYFEGKMDCSDDQQVYNSWLKISTTGFSFDAIHQYLVQRVSDG